MIDLGAKPLGKNFYGFGGLKKKKIVNIQTLSTIKLEIYSRKREPT